MNKIVKYQKMTSTQLFILAFQTCQWWNAVFMQARRFFDILGDDHGGDPWKDERNSLFLADRTFLIMAIFHALEDLEKLDTELQRTGDISLQAVLQALYNAVPREHIKNLRDMNEHSLDYLMEQGQKQDRFRTSFEKDGQTLYTTAAWTYINGNTKTFLLGNVEITPLLSVMKEQLPFVREKTKEVFEKGLMNS